MLLHNKVAKASYLPGFHTTRIMWWWWWSGNNSEHYGTRVDSCPARSSLCPMRSCSHMTNVRQTQTVKRSRDNAWGGIELTFYFQCSNAFRNAHSDDMYHSKTRQGTHIEPTWTQINMSTKCGRWFWSWKHWVRVRVLKLSVEFSAAMKLEAKQIKTITSKDEAFG